MAGLIVHEWLEPRGGAERVVDSMREAFPDADLLALWNDAPEKYPDAQETWLAKTPLRRNKAAALGFMPTTWRHVRPFKSHAQHDWMLVSSQLFAHHVQPSGLDQSIPKYVYAHTPARYIWEPGLDGRGSSNLVRLAAGILKPLDRYRAQEPLEIAANSEFVRERIQRAWNRDAKVIYPPVDVQSIKSTANWREALLPEEEARISHLPGSFILGASRFVPYKRLDWVIEAGEKNDVPVVIAGSGPDESRLRILAQQKNVPVHFVENPSTELLYALYQAAAVFVFPPVEDFGIMPVEAQAAGTPVVVTNWGGAVETSNLHPNSVASTEDTPECLAQAVSDVLSKSRVPLGHLSDEILSFDRQSFVKTMKSWVLP